MYSFWIRIWCITQGSCYCVCNCSRMFVCGCFLRACQRDIIDGLDSQCKRGCVNTTFFDVNWKWRVGFILRKHCDLTQTSEMSHALLHFFPKYNSTAHRWLTGRIHYNLLTFQFISLSWTRQTHWDGFAIYGIIHALSSIWMLPYSESDVVCKLLWWMKYSDHLLNKSIIGAVWIYCTPWKTLHI